MWVYRYKHKEIENYSRATLLTETDKKYREMKLLRAQLELDQLETWDPLNFHFI